MTIAEEEEKDRLFNNSHRLIVKTGELINNISKRINYNYELPNVAITYNNKIVELIALYNNHNMTFYSAFLEAVILRHLTNLLVESCNSLNEIGDIIVKNNNVELSDEQFKEAGQNIGKLIEKYEALNKEIFNFDLEKDIISSIDEDVEYWNEQGQNGEYDLYSNDGDQLITNYNNELQDLGINQRYTKSVDNTLVVDSQKLKDIFLTQREEISNYFKKNNINAPIIQSALESQLLDYFDEASSYYSNNEEMYKMCVDKMKNFDVMSEIKDSTSKYFAYWDDVNKFHNNDEWSKAKEELEKMGLSDIITQIQQDLDSDKYKDYVEDRNESVKDSNEELLRMVEEAVKNESQEQQLGAARQMIS